MEHVALITFVFTIIGLMIGVVFVHKKYLFGLWVLLGIYTLITSVPYIGFSLWLNNWVDTLWVFLSLTFVIVQIGEYFDNERSKKMYKDYEKELCSRVDNRYR